MTEDEGWLVTSFEDQHVLVIGGSSGMGRGAARALAARGAAVTVTSRSAERVPDAVAAVLADLEPAGGAPSVGPVDGVTCDLADQRSIQAAVAAPARLDHLVVTAAPGAGGTDRDFFDGKFWGSRWAAQAAGGRLPPTGSVLLVSGGLAVRPRPGQWSVTCAFAAVEALARALAVELAPTRANCIRPGLFDTATWDGMEPSERESFLARRAAVLPAGRAAVEEDFGIAAVGVLAATYLTGHVLVLDGGEALLGG